MSTLRNTRRVVFWSLLAIWLGTLIWQMRRPMPPGTDIETASLTMPAAQIQFLYDLTTRDAWGRPIVEQQIFDAIFSAIDQAQRFIVLDFFLLNSDMGQTNALQRPLSRELADRLLARKRAVPQIQILLITDPINDVYGGRPSLLLAELERAGIDVVRTDLTAMRDSNPLYSAAWRMLPQWLGNSAGGGWMPDPFSDHGKVTLRSWLALLNLKANHRKVLVADNGHGDWLGIVTSANPHDASSLHSNVALRFTGEIAASILESELKVAHFSGWQGTFEPGNRVASTVRSAETIEVRYVTEHAIRHSLLDAIAITATQDRIDMAMFYLSDRSIVDALCGAAGRGVHVRLILDPNKDAFGMQKDGVPNRPVANELTNCGGGNIVVRWYRTAGEQFHTKMTLVERRDSLLASLGSANLTRRNIGNYNLEANLQIKTSRDSAIAEGMLGFFERLWNNDEANHIEYTAPFGAYRDESELRYWRYRVMEATGLSSF